MRKHIIASAIAIVSLGAVAMPVSADHGDHGEAHRVRLLDNCDPATFNAALGDGSCVPHGIGPTTTLPEFLAKLNPVDFGHPRWGNKPRELEIDQGDTLKVVVRGGEGHTFTEVAKFGPGCIPELNVPLGLTGPAPTAAQCFGPKGFFATTFVAPNGGSTLVVSGLSPGTHLFMCEIHPWMRTTVRVEGDREHENDD